MEYKFDNNKISLMDNEIVVAYVEYEVVSDKMLNILHTYCNPDYRGKGYAQQIMMEYAKYLKEHNYQSQSSCSYATKWFNTYKEYQDLYVE